MKRFIEGVDRGQITLFPDRLNDWIGDDNPVRVIDVFVDELDLGALGFGGSRHGRRVGRAISLRFFSSSISTATSTGFSRAGALNGKPAATLK